MKRPSWNLFNAVNNQNRMKPRLSKKITLTRELTAWSIRVWWGSEKWASNSGPLITSLTTLAQGAPKHVYADAYEYIGWKGTDLAVEY